MHVGRSSYRHFTWRVFLPSIHNFSMILDVSQLRDVQHWAQLDAVPMIRAYLAVRSPIVQPSCFENLVSTSERKS